MLVEDQPDFRDFVALLLGREPDLEVVAQAGSLTEARSHAAKTGFDVAVLDLGLPDGNGADLIRDLRETHDGVAVLILSAGLDSDNLARVAKAGVDEILDKFAAPREIVGAVRRCGAEKAPVSRE